MSINVLPEDVVKRIAAGEVIERPVSVVKELIENSIDAGASRIEIRIEGGGIDGIAVTDNGCGISRDDISKLLRRHSTSKIKNEDDLGAIMTLGFRGEALYSIASVTKLRIRTRHRDENEGTELISDDGKITVNTISAPPGTTIESTGLFYNTPARRKFLKSPAAEFTRIADLVSRYVLAHPEISCELFHNGRSALHSFGGSPQDPLIALWGAKTAAEMLPVEFTAGKTRINGFVSSPSITRSSRQDISIFINGRLVKDNALNTAVERPFKNLIKPGRYPMAILKISIPPEDVDVNVHPNKREVRFADAGAIFGAVQAACEKAIRMHRPLKKPENISHAEISNPPSGEYRNDYLMSFPPELPAEVLFLDQEFEQPEESSFERRTAFQGIRQGQVIEFLNTYLIFEQSDELVIVDFHNLHERILFEEMEEAERSGDRRVLSQRLIFPENFGLPPDLAQILENESEFINKMGFDIEPFGSGAFLLRGVPHFLKDSSAAEALIDILTEIKNETSQSGAGAIDFARRFKISTACKAAVKAGAKLKPEEIEFLLRHAFDARFINCPHGRPTIIKLDRSFFDRHFKRKSHE